ncbi:MAG: TPM domain-containing protein [Acidobacteria bacterium]|nr:TPM domain-containing protein [Acidobacteriota bacterium]
MPASPPLRWWGRLLACCLLASFPLPAADWKALKPTGYVNDFAGVISPGSVRKLNDYCARLEKATGAQIAIVTIETLDNEPVDEVANLLYRQFGVGQKGKNEGALFLLSIRDRRSRLEVGYGLEPILPDGFAGSLLRELRPALRQADYDSALNTAVATIGERIAQAKGVTLTGPAPKRVEKEVHPGWVIGGIVVLLLLLALFGIGRGNLRGGGRGSGVGDVLTGMAMGALLNSGRGGRGSGGFGGYDSGGGFGGFGGGDSGGGGASSDW